MQSFAEPVVLVLIGPGGVGKGTLARRLVEDDDRLWLSRSWTTRPRRPGESEDAYVFVDREAFEGLIADEGFLEWAEFLGHLYGTPMPVPPPGSDVLLEIDLDGAHQVVGRIPAARVILIVPPTEQHQIERLRTRGDTEEHVIARVERGREEIAAGRQLAHFEVVNDDLEASVGELLSILGELRDARNASDHQNEAP